MLAFNQTKHPLSWALSGQKFACEPWGSIDIPGELWGACVRLGLPLDVAPVPPERRAKERVEDERKASDDSVLLALKDRVAAAEAAARTIKEELERTKIELSDARSETTRIRAENDKLVADIVRIQADKKTAEDLLDDAAKRATDAEAKAIRIEALASERAKAKSEKRPAAG